MPPHQIILFIIGTVVILFGAYYVTYFVGMKASGRTRAGLRSRNINILDQFSVARDKGFYVVEVAGKVYIVGATANSMTLLDKYELQEYEELALLEGEGVQVPWANTPVGQYGNRLTKKVVTFIARKIGRLPEEDAGGESGVGSGELGVRGKEPGVRGDGSGVRGEGSGKEAEKASFSDSLKKAEENAAEEISNDTAEDD